MARKLDIRCASESIERAEPLLGTASRVRRWLLLEQPGPWGEEVPVDSRMDPELAQTMRSRARRSGVRLVLIRRPGWRKPEHGPRAYLAHTGRRGSWIERIDLDEPADAHDLDLARTGDEQPPGIGEPGPDLVTLVCTNGRHDPCCADLGRPVVKALDADGTHEVWESSHVGGDRFAANLVGFPLGAYFGRVDPDRAVDLVSDLAEGVLHLDHYRGRSCFSSLVQAADIFVRRELDEAAVDGLTVRSAAEGAGGDLVVQFDHSSGPVSATVGRRRGPEEQLTCHANGLARPWRYHLVDLDRSG